PSPSWSPTPEPGPPGDTEGSAAAALAFLQTGDAQRLARANCSRGVAVGAAGPGPPPVLRAALRAAPEALAHAANFLNMLFQTNDIREASVAEDVEWYQALVRSLAEGHPWVRRAVLALDAHPLAAKPRLMLQATKKDGEILLQDVSATAAPGLGNLSWDNEWFNALKSQRNPLLRKRLLSNDLRSMETPKWQRGDSYVGEPAHVRWSPPFLECRDGKFLPAWAVTLSSAFYGLKPDLSPEFKGVVRVDIELRDVAIDQCSTGPGWFADTHRCDLNSTQCVPQESRGFVLGRYLCRCKPGFYGANGVASGARAGAVGAEGGSRLGCQPCRQGCATCRDDAPCLIQEDRALRAAVLSCQACCMLAVFLSMLISYHFRHSKRIRASGVILLETILFGSLLLYFPVFILYFKPSIFRCIVLRWVRMLGFAIVYGTITLKLYRVLKVFLSRSAQRVPYVSSGRVLKMLGLILLLVLWFLAAWTVGMLENVDKNIPLVVRTQTPRGLHFYICGHDRWDYMMVIAEMLFLLWGSSLCFATRAVPSAFHEPRYMGIALHNELMISAAFHVARFIMVPSLHPDWTLLLFFAHTHGTITMTLALLFIPKFLHAGSPLREEIAAEVYEDELDMRRSGSCLNSSIASAWSEHSLDPDDIREELKKLYRQLEVHKTRRMAANNPHLPKKRSSRRSLGRSLTRRATETPEGGTRRGSGERGGTPTHHGSWPKRLPEAGGASLRMREEGSRRRVPSLGGSRSTQGPTREPPGGSSTPGTPTPGRETTAVRAGERSDSESLEDAPLVCKSASAHDLGGHGRPPQPHAAPPLQKSLSVVAGAREEALLAASRAAREKWASRQPSSLASQPPDGHGPPSEAGKPQSPPADDATPPAGSSPTEGCPQEDVSPPGDGKVQKHVTYAPIKSISIDSSPLPGRVRVAVRKTPPPPPVRYQSLGRRVTVAGDSPGTAETPTDPLAQAGEGTREGTQEGTEEEEPERVSPPSGKGRLLSAASIPAQVCPWELVQDEILSQKQKAAEAAASGTPGEAATTPPSLQPPPPQKMTIRSLGLAIKAFNRSRGKSRNNNASTDGEGADWGYWGGEAEGRWDSPALGTGDTEKVAEEPGAPQGDLDAGTGHQEGAEDPCETPAVAGSGKALTPPQRGDKGPMAELGKDAPGATTRLMALKEGVAGPAEGLDGGSRSIQPQDRTKVEQPNGEPTPGSPHSPTTRVWGAATEKVGAEVCPQGPPAIPAGKAALQRQEAIAPQEDGGVPWGRESPAKGLEKGGSQPEPLGPVGGRGTQRVPAKSQSVEVVPAAVGKGSSTATEAEVTPSVTGKSREDKDGLSIGSKSTSKNQDLRKETQGLLKETGESMGGKKEKSSGDRESICPWESLGTEETPEKPRPRSPALPKSPSKKSQSVESLKAEVCPWEVPELESTEKAAIFPWEVAAPPSEQPKAKQGPGGASKGEKRITRQAALGSPVRSLGQGSSEREAICPWESLGTEETPEKPYPRSPVLPKSSSKKSQSVESLKAEVCPWEAQELEPTDKAEICPWEAEVPSSGKEKSRQDKDCLFMGSRNPSKSQGVLKETGESTAAKKEKSSGDRESICPWESLGTEETPEKPRAKSPALPKSPSKKSQSVESLKAEVCPWEAQELEADDKAEVCPWEAQELEPTDKAEICPWEAEVPSSGKEKSRQDKDCLFMGSRNPSKSQGVLKETGESTAAKKEKSSGDRESICPWESLGTEETPEKPRAKSPALPKSPSKKSQSVESLKAEVCPWEAQELEADDKAEICPWEVAAPPSGKGKGKLDKDGLSIGSRSPSKSQGLLKETGESTAGKKEKSSGDRESICPWESLGTEETPEKPRAKSPALPKSPSKKSQSVESLKAEVCPWEAQELEADDKAEICPWEVAAPPSGKGKGKLDKDGLSIGSRSPSKSQGLLKETGESTAAKKEKSSGDRESICPWESLGTEETPEKPRAKSPALPKSPSKKSQSVESLKAEVCPWEAQELEPTDKAAICPWEAEVPPSVIEKSRQDKDGLSIVSKSPSKSQGLREETGESTAAKKEKSSGDRESICPWESLGTEETPEKPRAKSPALPKSPSKKSQSVESLKAEVCPWEAQELEPTDKAAICPWEAEVPPSVIEKSRQDKDGLSIVSKSPSKSQGLREETGESTAAKKEKSSGDRESICPWESLGTEETPEKPRAKSPALPKSSSKKSQSVESLKAEVCPWEAQELEPTDKAEICPWEVAAPPSGKEKGKLDKDGLSIGSRSPSESQGVLKGTGESTSAKKEKSSNDREPICPWESLGTEETPEKPCAKSPALPKSSSKKSQSVESLKAEVCPWEAQEFEAGGKAEICPWEVAAPLPEKEAALGQTSLPPKKAGAPKSLEKGSSEREAICPWESLDMEEPSLQSAMGKEPSKKSESTESRKSSVGAWEVAEPTGWEKESLKPGKEKGKLDKDGLSIGSRSPSESQGVLKGTGESTSAKKEKSSKDRESICPWESLGTEETPEKPCAKSPALPKSSSKKSQSVESLKAEVCPWEAQEFEAGGKAEICPWEVAAPLPEKEAALGQTSLPPKKAGAPKSLEKGSSEREAICPWESLDMEEPSLQSAMGKEPSKKSESTESRKSSVGAWEVAEPTGWEKESLKPGVHPRGAARGQGQGTGKSQPVAGASTRSPPPLGKKTQGRSDVRAEHKPLCRVLPGTQPPRSPPPRGGSTAPVGDSSPSITQVCPWEAEEAPPASGQTSTDTRKTSEVCPWEVESVEPPLTPPRTGGSPQDRDRAAHPSDTKPEVCPWEEE
ncbi:PREDICTED: probable G-protein coupled receptor 179, partial [Calidris pugnax]|uniref:probable G-protein coupled receptor 179 n=1 Tax=Calidris pugnax TaxID=198806 RepID=UPI00071C27D7